MSDESQPQPRLEPVRDAAALAAAVSGLVTAVGAGIVLTGWASSADVQQWAVAAGGIVTALGALLSAAMPLITARGARAQVTPLASPRDNYGRPLVPAPAAAGEEHGRHEASPEPEDTHG